MPDVLTPEQRKRNMSQIRGRNTIPEWTIRKKLYSRGIRGYRIHYNLPGKPDIVFIRKRVVIFIDGCSGINARLISRNLLPGRSSGLTKLKEMSFEDRKIDTELIEQGWQILRIWEHEVKKDPDWYRGLSVL